MADLKITQLPSASVATGSNVLPIVQDGVTDQITVTNLGKGILELGLSITGSTITASGGFTGSLLGTASAAISSSYALSASYAPSSALPSGLISGSAQILGLGFPSTSSTDELSNKTLINPLIGSFKITSDGESRMGQYANNVEFFSKDGFLINPATTRAVFIDAYDDANKVVITSDLLSYARTGSTNTFYDNQTISGSLNITGSISITGSGTLNGGNILTSYDTGSFVTTSSLPLSYGLFNQTGSSIPISASVSELSLVGGGVGSLNIPANLFKKGDAYHAILIGRGTFHNNDTLEVFVKAGDTALADTGVMILSGADNKYWKLEIFFTINNIGAAGVASITSGGTFMYSSDSADKYNGIIFNTINSTTFDTTVSNTLQVTGQFSSILNIIYSDVFTLNKTF